MKIDDTAAYRVWPKKHFGGMPNLDQFIEPGDNPTNVPTLRWKVDTTHFPNLTEARRHVRITLELGDNTELCTHAHYIPATGFTCSSHSTTTKGSTMARTQLTAADIQVRLDAAQTELTAIEGADTTHMLDAALLEHKKKLASAKSKVSYQKGMLVTVAQRSNPPAESPTIKTDNAVAAPNKETIVPATSAKPKAPAPVEHLPRRMDRMGEATPMPRYEISFPTAATGRRIDIKVNDNESLDHVMQMIVKHGL